MHPCITASSPSLARVHKHTRHQRAFALSHVICATGFRRHLGGIGATLLVLSSLKHLRYLQTYTYFQAQARLCISLRQAMGDIRCWKFNLCYLAILS